MQIIKFSQRNILIIFKNLLLLYSFLQFSGSHAYRLFVFKSIVFVDIFIKLYLFSSSWSVLLIVFDVLAQCYFFFLWSLKFQHKNINFKRFFIKENLQKSSHLHHQTNKLLKSVQTKDKNVKKVKNLLNINWESFQSVNGHRQ